MGQRILLIESDSEFSDQVVSGFARLGVAVEVAVDGPQGLEVAGRTRPDLVLLTIELSGMNGFLVCKKLKKNADLHDVPVVILSSEASDDSFDQHKKLKIRADAYVRKPIEFEALVAEVRSFVEVDESAPAEGDDDEEPLFVDDEDMVVIDEVDSVVEAGPGAEVAAFTDDAIDSLQAGPGAESLSPKSSIPPPLPGSNAPPVSAGSSAMSDSSSGVDSARLEDALIQAEAGRDAVLLELTGAKTELEQVREELRSAQAAENAALAQVEQVQAAAKLAPSTAGASGRDVLELREQLSKKDRELLNLRTQIGERDTRLLDGNDKALQVERELADLRDELNKAARDTEVALSQVAKITADAEAERRKGERLADEAASSSLEIARIREEAHAELAKAVAEAAAAKSARETAASETRARHEAEKSRLAVSHAAEMAELRDVSEATVATAERKCLAEIEALKNDQDRRAAELQAQHALATEKALALSQESLAARERDLNAVHSASMMEVETQKSQLEAQLTDLKQGHQSELATVGRLLKEAEESTVELKNRLVEEQKTCSVLSTELEGAVQERDSLRALEAGKRAEVAQLREAAARQTELTDRARKAMAIGLGLLSPPTD